MNDLPKNAQRDTCARTTNQRASLIEDIATLVVLQHRRQQRDLVRVDDHQQQVVSKPAKELIETRQNE